MYDYIDNVSFTNQSCQYALNQLFINSNFSKHYKGHSDIVNAQNYKMSMANILEAIGGKSGSILDTFGTGAELLRDPKYFRAIYQVSGIWETAGYGSIVYFAAILAISPTNYEAAKMDGANKWAQIRYVTFPGIASTLTIMSSKM